MSVSLALLLTAGVLVACGVYLVLERTLTRVVLGFVLLGNGVNLLFIVAAGRPGTPPFEGSGDPEGMTDPLPLAMVLTAIVISLGVTAFGMALAYRAWQLFGHDEVPDDVEDRRVLRRGRRRQAAADESAEEIPEIRWSQELSEESRRGALLRSQGGRGAGEDPLGADLSGADDVPQDPTEADEGESRPGRSGPSAAATLPGAGPTADPDHPSPGDPATAPSTTDPDPQEGSER